MSVDLAKVLQDLIVMLTMFGMKLVGATILWFIGRYLIKIVCNLLGNVVTKQPVDPTIGTYLSSALNVALNITLVLAILGFFGVETTTFAALLAAVGIAIGTAWSGLLSNFAAGVFLVILHPFKVGDFVAVSGVSGTVEEIGLFVTTIITKDDVKTFVGNSKIMSDNIQNFTANKFRYPKSSAQLNHSAEPKLASCHLEKQPNEILDVVSNSKLDAEALQSASTGIILAIHPYQNDEYHWRVYFDRNQVTHGGFSEDGSGYLIPKHHFTIKHN